MNLAPTRERLLHQVLCGHDLRDPSVRAGEVRVHIESQELLTGEHQSRHLHRNHHLHDRWSQYGDNDCGLLLCLSLHVGFRSRLKGGLDRLTF